MLQRALDTTEADWGPTINALQEIVAVVRSMHATLLLSHFPLQVEVQIAQEELAQHVARRLQRFAEEQGVCFTDMTPVLRRVSGPSLFYDDVHLTRAGHEVVASTLVEAIVECVKWPNPA